MDKEIVRQLARYMRWQDTSGHKPAAKTLLANTVLKPLREWLHSAIAFFRKKTFIQARPCDVLLLHYSKTTQARGYRNALVAQLRQSGLTVIETAIYKPKTVLSQRKLLTPGWSFLHRYYYHAAYACWIVARYQPRVILTDKNGSVLAPFLKHYLPPHGKLVHVAHSIPTDNFRKFSMNAYDYYFLFGESSLERLRRRKLFGTSRVFLTGSYSEKRPLPLPERYDTVLILGTGPALEKTEAIRRAYRIICQTATLLPALTFIVKPHPRSDKGPWLTGSPPANLRVADPGTDIDVLLARAFVAIGSFTNAAIDCALQQRPYILVSDGTQDTQLDIHRMTHVCSSPDTLAREIRLVMQQPAEFQARAAAFAHYHLATAFEGPATITRLVHTLVQRGTLEGGILLEGETP